MRCIYRQVMTDSEAYTALYIALRPYSLQSFEEKRMVGDDDVALLLESLLKYLLRDVYTAEHSRGW